ncbi:MAG: type III pantothenate kinase [Planctomycetota bacterium]|nr:type III pantothenate kinase [Planctomycetota bacterium]
MPAPTQALDLILVIDVGNSGAKLGAVRGDDVAGPVRLPRVDGRAVREIAAPMLKGKQAIIAIAGSDPARIEGLVWELSKLRLGTVTSVGPDHKGIPAAAVASPARVGVDRRVQVLAACHLAGEAAVVISCGSALTVDLGRADGALTGGAIAPGLGMGARALADGTARLPLVDLAGEAVMPAGDTEPAIRAGLLIGGAGAVERLLAVAGVGPERPVYLTGADAPHLKPHLQRSVRSHPGLSILGVALAVRASPPR